METSTVAWKTGSGYITLTYNGQGDGSVSVASDANDMDTVREQYITVETSNGSPRRSISVLIRQKNADVSGMLLEDGGYMFTEDNNIIVLEV